MLNIDRDVSPITPIVDAIVAGDQDRANAAYREFQATTDTREVQARGQRAATVLLSAVTGAQGRPQTLEEMTAYVNG